MKSNTPKNREGLFKSIMLAYTILVLHVFLLAGLGLLVLFFGGVAQYMFWIFMAGMAIVALSAYLFYRRLRREGRSLREALRSPMFQGRSVEISLLGGMASVRLGAPDDRQQPAVLDNQAPSLQLEDPETTRIRDIAALAQLLEKNLITPEEFDAAKAKLLGGKPQGGRPV